MKILGLDIKRAQKPVEQKSRVIMQIRVIGGQPIAYLASSGNDAIKETYIKNNIVFSLLNYKTNKIKNCPFVLYKVKNDSAKRKYKSLMTHATPESVLSAYKLARKEFTLVESHPVLDLLENPSLSLSRSEFYSGETIYRDVAGFSVIWKEKTLSGGMRLELLPSQEVEFQYGSNGLIQSVRLKNTPDWSVPYSDVIHTKRFNPLFDLAGSHLYGLGLAEVLQGVLTKYKDGNEAQIELYQNRGAKGIITPKDTNYDVDPTSAEEATRQLNAKLENGGAGRVVGNSIPLEYIQLGMSVADLSILENNKEARKDICAAFGINPIIFDWTDNSTYNNMQEARKSSLIDGVIPSQQDFVDQLNAHIIPPGYHLDYDYQAYPEMQADLDKQADRLAKSFWLSVNEKRAEQDFPPISNPLADEPLVPNSLRTLDDLGIDMSQPPMLP